MNLLLKLQLKRTMIDTFERGLSVFRQTDNADMD